MSAVADPPRTEPDLRCPRCGAGIARDQEWCVECGAAARTRIVRPPSSRGPVFVVAGILALIAAGLAIAFVDAADQGSQATASTPTAAPPAAAAAPTPPPPPAAATTPATPATPKTTGPTIHRWPQGRSAYTVILLTADHRTALQTARGLASSGVIGLARTDQFANINPGQWIVFTGHYSDHAAAETAATAAKSHGAAGAYVQYLTSR